MDLLFRRKIRLPYDFLIFIFFAAVDKSSRSWKLKHDDAGQDVFDAVDELIEILALAMNRQQSTWSTFTISIFSPSLDY